MRKKVLILEDMETTRTALKRIVESCDDAITAYAFSEVGPALACMMENHIDLFFVDIICKETGRIFWCGYYFCNKSDWA